jgi:hypothetical protein
MEAVEPSMAKNGALWVNVIASCYQSTYSLLLILYYSRSNH